MQSLSSYSEEKEGDGKKPRVLCPSVAVKLHVPGTDKYVETYAGLDTFSTDSWISKETLKELGAWDSSKSVSLALSTMLGKDENVNGKLLEKLEISDVEGSFTYQINWIYCRMEGTWPLSGDHVPTAGDIEGRDYLTKVPFNFIDKEIGIILGSRHSGLMINQEVIQKGFEDPYAFKCRLGWALAGIIREDNENKVSTCALTNLMKVESKIDALFAREFQNEDSFHKMPSQEDKEWKNVIENSIKKVDGHFQVDLPFKSQKQALPYNKKQAENRLESLKKRLVKDENYKLEYIQFMEDMLKKGYAEKVPKQDLLKPQNNIYYLTHFGVRHKTKHKLRIVFDASLKCQGVSLNDVLLQGPDLANSLIGVLLRFRQNEIAFMADIKSMFYQVKVSPQHQDYLRYLWFPNNDLNAKPEEYRVKVHIFGAVSSPSTANYVLKYIGATQEEGKYDPQTLQAIEKNFYVDDLCKSVATEEDASLIIYQIKNLLQSNGFTLTSFVSNKPQILKDLPSEDISKI